HVEEHLLEDGAQAAGTSTPQQRLLGHGLESILGELELDPVELEELAVLLDQRVLGLDEDAHESLLVEIGYRADDGQTAHELGDEPELEDVLGQDLRQDRAEVLLVGSPDVGAEPDALVADP